MAEKRKQKMSSLITMSAITGKPNTEKIHSYLKDLKENGIDEFLLYPRSGCEIEYLSNEWFDTVEKFVTTNKEYNYSTETFKKMIEGKLSDKKLYNKLVLKYIKNKKEIVELLKKYEKTKEKTILDRLAEINMFGFTFVGGSSIDLLSMDYYENELKPVVLELDKSASFENLIETFWWTEFDMRSNIFANILGKRKETTKPHMRY